MNQQKNYLGISTLDNLTHGQHGHLYTFTFQGSLETLPIEVLSLAWKPLFSYLWLHFLGL